MALFEIKGKSYRKSILVLESDPELLLHIHGLGNGYGGEDDEHDKYGCWCVITVKVKSHYFDYFKDHDELMMLGEIKTLLDTLNDLIDDKLTKDETLGFIEPDLSFIFQPKHDIREGGKKIWKRDGNYIADISGEMIFHLHDKDGVYTAEEYRCWLGCEELTKLRDYLSEVYAHLEKEWAASVSGNKGDK